MFLGLADRAAYVRDSDTNLFKWNVLGLRNVVLSNIFPLPLTGLQIGFAISATAITPGSPLKFRIVDQAGNEVGTISLELQPPAGFPADSGIDQPGIALPMLNTIVLFALLCPDAPMLALEPGKFEVRHVMPHGEEVVGQIFFAVVDPPPLTPERIAAIRSDPTASKAARIEIGCKNCDSKCRVYSALDPIPKFEAEGWTWFEKLPDRFACSCGKTDMALLYLKRNLHALLGANAAGSALTKFTPLYERGSLESVRSTFARLLDASPKEERLQQFLQNNPILLHQFAALRLFAKPPILTYFIADFALVTPKKELLLVELERGNTRLMKKDGDIAAPLSHAFDQVRNWLEIVDEHRIAVLDALKIERNDIGAIRGIVIAGRDVGYDARHLRRLKSEDRGRVTFYTYDDLLFALAALLEGFDRL
jgi:hypothetical protein